MTAEQLEAARAERMRQNGHGAITIEDVRTWIEETGLCIFLPRTAQAGFTAPTFVEAVAGQRTTEPTPELIAQAESLLVRLEAEGVAVRLNLAGQPLNHSGDQPDYVVAGWVLPYIYALRGDRDWRRSPQLTGSRQVSQLAVLAAKQIDTANLTAAQIRDALGREITETAVLRALHELWKQLRIIPVVPEVGVPGLWQPLRQRFQKAIAEGASTSQVTAISVLASIYLQAVIAASMEDVELFLSPLTSRSKIREVVRGLAATRQVHSTTMGHSPMFYVAGTLPEFPAVPSFQINSGTGYGGSSYGSSRYGNSGYNGTGYNGSSYNASDNGGSRYNSYRNTSSRGPSYSPAYLDELVDDGHDGHDAQTLNGISELIDEPVRNLVAQADSNPLPIASAEAAEEVRSFAITESTARPISAARPAPVRTSNARPSNARLAARPGSGAKVSVKPQSSGKAAPPRPRTARDASAAHPRDRKRTGVGSGAGSEGRTSSSNGSRRAPAPRTTASNASSARSNGHNGNGHHANGSNGAKSSKPLGANGNGHSQNGNAQNGHSQNGHTANGNRSKSAPASSRGSWSARPASSQPSSSRPGSSRPGTARPASNGKTANGSAASRPVSRQAESRPSAQKPAGIAGATGYKSARKPASTAADKTRKPIAASAAKRYSFSGQAKQVPKPIAKSAPASASRSSQHSAKGSKPAGRGAAATKRRG